MQHLFHISLFSRVVFSFPLRGKPVLWVAVTCLLISLLVLSPVTTQAQKNEFSSRFANMSIESNFIAGRIWKHTPKFAPAIIGHVDTYELNFAKRTDGSSAWHQLLNYPEIGVAMLYSNFGNRTVFGRSYGIAPSISFYMLNKPWIEIYMRLYTGFALLNRPWDPVSNPVNNVIGSRINNITSLRLGSNWRLGSNHWWLKAGLTYLHYSNGHYSNPNLGINVPSAHIGLKYRFDRLSVRPPIDTIKSLERRFTFHLRMGLAFNERGRPGGPPYPIYNTALWAALSTSRVNRILAGLDLSHNTGIRDFIVIQEIKDKSLFINASNAALFIADELMLGRVGISGSVGYYVYYPVNKVNATYFKLGLVYYHPISSVALVRGVFAGIYLKSHQVAADYVDFVVGLSF